MAESQWHLEVNGKKVGPFTLDQIQGLYEDGEIRGYHQVTSDQLHGKWITVQELVDSAGLTAPAPPPEITGTGELPTLEPPVSETINLEPELGPTPTLDTAPELEAASILESAPVLEAAPVLEVAAVSVAAPVAEAVEPTQAFSLPALEEAEEQIGEEPALYTGKASEITFKPSQKIFKEPRQDFNADFQPPPRPADLSTSTSPHAPSSVQAQSAHAEEVAVEATTLEAQPGPGTAEPGTAEPVVATAPYAAETNRAAADPAMSLLSSLQNLRERQTSQIQHDPTIVLDTDSISRGRKPVPMRMWLTAIFAGIILGALSIGLIKIFRHHPVATAPGSLTEINQSKPQPPTAAGQPPTAPPTTANAVRGLSLWRNNIVRFGLRRPPRLFSLKEPPPFLRPGSVRDREPPPQPQQPEQDNRFAEPNRLPPQQQQVPNQPPMQAMDPDNPQGGGARLSSATDDPNLQNGNGYHLRLAHRPIPG